MSDIERLMLEKKLDLLVNKRDTSTNLGMILYLQQQIDEIVEVLNN